MMVDLLYRLHKWEELEELVDASIQWTNAQGHWSVMHSLEVHRAILDLRHGAWLTAEQRLRELIDSIDEPGLLVSHAYPVLGRLLARRGSPDAFQIIDTAWRRAVTGKAILTVVDAGVAYVEWAWLNDRPDLAIVVRDTILGDFPAAAGPLFGELRRYLDRAGAPLDPEVPGRSPLFEPIADGLDGDWKSAAEGWQRAGDEYEAALELASSGTIGPMTEAVAILEKLGADRVAAQFRRELRSRGVHIPSRPSPQKSSTANPAGLSDRQLEVLLLLAEGLPNREIADRLVVSVRTVDHHVAAILSKLGAMNRREAATIARSWRLSANITEDPTHTANRP
jgi:DNA-binding CsgD family transcriptional regulator